MDSETSILAKTPDNRDVLLPMNQITALRSGKARDTVIVERADGGPIEIVGTVAALAELFNTHDMRPKKKAASVVSIWPRAPR